jgi:flagella basal body P-ring formation protein FlgA
MSKKVNIILTTICLLVPVNSNANSTKKDSALQVYLPREVAIKDSCLSLGKVGIIRGEESLVAKASEITLGRISVPGQKLIIDKAMILSRLACNGIPASKVTLTGAEKITVKQQEHTISSDEFVKLANAFLKKNPPSASVCEWDLTRQPEDFIIPGVTEEIRLSPRSVQSSARNQAKVEICILSNGKKIGVSEVTFQLKYNCREIVTKLDIAAGTSISPENVKIRKMISNVPEPADWKPPYGLVSKRQIPANTVLQSNMVGPVKPPIVVKRNKQVVIRIDRPAFSITAIGKAMQEGRAGEYIKVRNVDSQRIILARVNEDGSVEPVF